MSEPLDRRAALRTAAAAVVGVASAGALAGCTRSAAEDDARHRSTPATPEDEARLRRHEVTAGPPEQAGTLDPAAPGGPAAATLAASRALVGTASIVVVTSDQAADLASGTAAAVRLGIPMLVQGPGVAGELDRLGVRTVLRFSSVAAVPTTFGDREVVDGGGELADLPGLPLTSRPGRATVLVLEGAKVPAALTATLAAVGATPLPVHGTDPRTAADARAALTKAATTGVLAVGAGFGPAARFAQRVRTARRAPELPGGGLLPFPGRRMVALYGHPQTAALGMLGEQSAAQSVERVRAMADRFQRLTRTTVVPAFELIATVASGSAQPDGSYSRRTAVSTLLPWVQAAERAGVYVVLDLQPGRADFLDQARQYEPLLRRPWVGLALDPEWRLGQKEKPLRQIGHVGIDEVNRVGAWLAGLVREHDLPPKVLTLHQFSLSMVRDRGRLDTSLDEVQWLVHADGQGGQGAKQDTWSALRHQLPDGVWLGWKNFEDEDTPMLTPEQTVAQVHPTPYLVSYQ
jgi:hypothetical protein